MVSVCVGGVRFGLWGQGVMWVGGEREGGLSWVRWGCILHRGWGNNKHTPGWGGVWVCIGRVGCGYQFVAAGRH